MNQQIKVLANEQNRGLVIDESLLPNANIGAKIVTGAIGEPKLPPYVND